MIQNFFLANNFINSFNKSTQETQSCTKVLMGCICGLERLVFFLTEVFIDCSIHKTYSSLQIHLYQV
jgi:hypothetical protein